MGTGGSITGTVEISAALASRRPQFRIYADARPATVVPRVPDNELRSELRNVVVYLQADRGTPLPSPDGATDGVMSQVHERFEPHVLPVLQGARVEFPNYDDIYHNVFSLSRARTFNLGRFPRGESRGVRFDKTGIVKVFCDIHSHMAATVIVFNHPWFTVPAADGTFELDNLPSGNQQVTAWHERLGETTLRVRTEAGRTASVEFVLPVPAQ